MWSTWPQLPAPHWPCLRCTGLTPHISSLFLCSIFMNYPSIWGCTLYLLLYLQYLFLFGKYRKRCSFSLCPFLCPTFPFSHSSFLFHPLLTMFFIPFICMTKCFFSCAQKCLSLTYPVDILSGHLDWGQMPRPVAEPIDRKENQGQRWLWNTTAEALIAGTVNPYLTTSLNVVHTIFMKVL